jgi:poly-gamma-glutamate synthesis protein (capsule biosynthesis protein)
MRLSRRQLLVSLPAVLAAGGTAVARTAATCGTGRRAVRLLLTGDVMCGRGVDRILPHPSDPRIFEPRVRDARDHVRLAERAHGEIPKPVGRSWPRGDAVALFRSPEVDLRIVDPETAITTSPRPWPEGIDCRMHPDDLPLLVEARIDRAVLADNHVLDRGFEGLLGTLGHLERAGIRPAGAGRNAALAAAPAVLRLPGRGRALVFAMGHGSSGIPPERAARPDRPGVHLLEDLSGRTPARIGELVERHRRPADLLLASIHRGGNRGHGIPPEHRRFAHGLAELGFHLVHGHSSHHARAVEIAGGVPILRGCGDVPTDDEGIEGDEEFRDDPAVAWLPSFRGPPWRLEAFEAAVFRIRRMRLGAAPEADRDRLAAVLERESRPLGVRVEAAAGNRLRFLPADDRG